MDLLVRVLLITEETSPLVQPTPNHTHPFLFGKPPCLMVVETCIPRGAQDDLNLTSDMNISCETTVYMQACCSKAASKLETCFPKLCLEPDDT